MSGVLVFLVPRQFDIAVLQQKIAEMFTIQETGEEAACKLYYDTFDWRLFREGLVLSRQAGRYTLSRKSGEVLCSGGGTRRKNPFCRDFQEGELKDRLEKVIEVRALMPRFSVSTRMSRFRLLNSDEKTVLRLTHINADGQYGEQQFNMQPAVLLEPLRGYHKPYSLIRDMLTHSGLTECRGGYDLVAQVLAELAIDPNETDSKFSADLRRDETVGQAVRDICLSLRSAILRNVPGTLDDIDSEFLHDLRVAMRRTRSLLSLMKKYLPAADVAHFQKEFKWLGDVTGPVRDLDVYLLKNEEYRAMLPEELHFGLSCFFEGLSRQRKRELRLLRASLRSTRFTELLGEWQQFLLQLPDRDDYPQGRRPCRKVAEKIIRKRFARILRHGQAITVTSADEKLHELRIAGKKFRYILEFFRSLFNAGRVDEYLKQMKKLQNNLGDYNDLSVQKGMLVRLLADMRGGSEHVVAVSAALGGLVVHLGDQQRQVRTMFEQTFENFATAENIELLEKIFSDSDAGAAGECDP